VTTTLSTKLIYTGYIYSILVSYESDVTLGQGSWYLGMEK